MQVLYYLNMTGEQISRNVNPVPEKGNVKGGNYQGGAAWVNCN